MWLTAAVPDLGGFQERLGIFEGAVPVLGGFQERLGGFEGAVPDLGGFQERLSRFWWRSAGERTVSPSAGCQGRDNPLLFTIFVRTAMQ